MKYKCGEFPAIKIARLAVDRRYRGQGYRLGTLLVETGIGLARRRIASVAGCRYIILDSKQQSIAFCKKIGFRLINTERNRRRKEPIMYRDLLHVEDGDMQVR